MYKVKPVLKVSAPKGYGLDDRFDYALSRFSNFSFHCSGGDPTSCKFVKKIILEWAKSDAAKRTGPSDGEGYFNCQFICGFSHDCSLFICKTSHRYTKNRR